ncbi:hypothetical protein IHE45_16G000100 [Dioscorea alata]|uniref:Uncharacterized protein n=1 Tax=Dioscorea alata TaxID=55571 RepID=A0ACB7UF91_DIOAL|nr:hypothetical protein IHE45_16G000100 [Dioscorea alata]
MWTLLCILYMVWWSPSLKDDGKDDDNEGGRDSKHDDDDNEEEDDDDLSRALFTISDSKLDSKLLYLRVARMDDGLNIRERIFFKARDLETLDSTRSSVLFSS